jgi:hypothetical protein
VQTPLFSHGLLAHSSVQMSPKLSEASGAGQVQVNPGPRTRISSRDGDHVTYPFTAMGWIVPGMLVQTPPFSHGLFRQLS